jgi:Na+/melibiose symporter-like transporter
LAAALARETAEPRRSEAAPPASKFLRRQSDLYRFGSAAVAIAAVASPVTIYLPKYYGAYVGMPVGMVALAFLIVRLFDISFDPLFGMLIDRTRTRFGQARPWLIAGVVLLTISAPWLFLAPKGVGLWRLVAGLLVMYAGFSMANLSQAAWSARLISDYTERSRIWGWIQIFGYIGTFLLFAAPLAFAGTQRGDIKNGEDVRMMGAILTVALPVMVLFALVGIPEPPVPAPTNRDERVKLSDYLALLRLRNVRQIVMTDIVLTLASGTTAILFLFFWSFARGYKSKESTIFVLTYMLSGFIGTPLWIWIAKRVGKRAALIASVLCYALLIPGMAVLPRNEMNLVVAGQFLLGLSYASGIFLLRSMAADTADEIRLHLGKDRTGQLFGLFGSTAKLGTAISAGYTLLLLQAAGFDAKLGVNNTPHAIFALELLYLAAPGVLMVVAAWLLTGYKLNRHEHDRILAELAVRDAEAATAAAQLQSAALSQ